LHFLVYATKSKRLPQPLETQNKSIILLFFAFLGVIFTQKFIRFDIVSDTTFIASPTLHKKDEKEIIYNLNGQQVDKASAQGGIFISRQKGKFYKAPGSSGGRR